MAYSQSFYPEQFPMDDLPSFTPRSSEHGGTGESGWDSSSSSGSSSQGLRTPSFGPVASQQLDGHGAKHARSHAGAAQDDVDPDVDSDVDTWPPHFALPPPSSRDALGILGMPPPTKLSPPVLTLFHPSSAPPSTTPSSQALPALFIPHNRGLTNPPSPTSTITNFHDPSSPSPPPPLHAVPIPNPAERLDHPARSSHPASRASRPSRAEEESARGRSRWPRLLWRSEVDPQALRVLRSYHHRAVGGDLPVLERDAGEEGVREWSRRLERAGL